MSGISTEQWERRKWYLVRSLFEENPILSPIPETQEVSLEPASPLETYISRPYSPLPDLIIEKEPNRHDEPEEYYHALEIKIKKLYRKLFIDTEKSPIFTELENDHQYFMLHNESCADTAIFVKESAPFEESRCNESSDSIDLPIIQSYEKRPSYIRRYTKSADWSGELQSTTSSESQNNEIIVTQALVHQADSEKTFKDVSHILVDKTQIKSSEITNHGVDVSPQSAREDTREQSQHEFLHDEFKDSSILNDEHEIESRSDVEEPISACLSDASSLPEVPELMRRQQTSNGSKQSISALDVERHFSAEFSTDKRLEVRDMEEAVFTSPELSVILESSTTKKQFQPRNGGKKRRLTSGIPTCQIRYFGKQRKYDSVAIQTSFSESDDENKWEEIQKHFFEGNPRIFKLCSCTNHVCC